MARVVLGARALADLERVCAFLAAQDAKSANEAIDAILDALGVLERHPLIGRPIEGELRELVISFGKTGYVALYRFRQSIDRAEVLSLRHQREAGYG